MPAFPRLVLFTLLVWLINSFSQENPKITFRVITPVLPDSASIYITGNDPQLGEWNPGWVVLDKQTDGSWLKTFSFKPGARLEYKFTRGTWQTEALDSNGMAPPNHKLNVRNDTTVAVKIDKWKEEDVQITGQITGTVRYHRDLQGVGIKPRDVMVWLPPGYATDMQKRYPALYMHDGQNVFDASTSFLNMEWRMDEVSDSLIRAGEMEEIIIVGVYNTIDRRMEYADSTAGHAYMRFLVDSLKPFIDQTYRTRPEAEHTAVMGSSLGGLISFLCAWYYPEVFSRAGCVSPAFLYQNYRSVSMVEEFTGPPKNIRIYMDNGAIGVEDSLKIGCERMLTALQKQGFELNENLLWFYDETADHSERAWARRVWRPLIFMFGAEKK